MLDVVDFTTNPAAPGLGRFVTLALRYGKSRRGSPPRRRQVATVMPWGAGVVDEYLREAWPRFGLVANASGVVVEERGERISFTSGR